MTIEKAEKRNPGLAARHAGAQLQAAPLDTLAATLRFYDLMCGEYQEYCARQLAVCYMRRKVEGLDYVTASVALAHALAERAELKATQENQIP